MTKNLVIADYYLYILFLFDLMAKHYLVAIEEKDEKLFRLFCEKNSKYAMAIGKETTSELVRLDYEGELYLLYE